MTFHWIQHVLHIWIMIGRDSVPAYAPIFKEKSVYISGNKAVAYLPDKLLHTMVLC